MMFLIFLCLTLFPVFTAAQNNCSSDQQLVVISCYLNYLNIYGFSVIPIFDLYDIAEDKYRNQGWNGELYMCSAGKKLLSCIGDNNADACITPEIFKNISGLSSYDDVYEYVSDYREMQYRCLGDGFTVFKDTYQCLQQMKDCPGNPQTCLEFIPYIQCMENMAYGFCGAEGSEYTCNLFDIRANVYLNCNNLPQCSKNQTQPFLN